MFWNQMRSTKRGQQLSLRREGSLWWVSTHIRLLSNGRKWCTIADRNAMEHQECYDTDSQEKHVFQKYQVTKDHKYACKRVKAVLNCPHEKLLTDEVTFVEVPQVDTQMVGTCLEGPLSVVLKQPLPCPSLSHYCICSQYLPVTLVWSGTCSLRDK